MKPTLPDIISAVCRETGCTPADISGRSRTPDITAARRAIVHLTRSLTYASYPELAAATTGRSWSTWICAERAAAELLDPQSPRHDPRFRAMVARAEGVLATLLREREQAAEIERLRKRKVWRTEIAALTAAREGSE